MDDAGGFSVRMALLLVVLAACGGAGAPRNIWADSVRLPAPEETRCGPKPSSPPLDVWCGETACAWHCARVAGSGPAEEYWNWRWVAVQP